MPLGRKMRLFNQTTVTRNEYLLQREQQLAESQGSDAYSHFASVHIGTREGGLKLQGKLLQAADLYRKADELEDAKQRAVDDMRGEPEDDDDEFGFNTDLPAAKVVQAPTAAAGSLGTTTASAAKKKQRKTKKGIQLEEEFEDCEDVSEGGVTSSSARIMDSAAFASADGEMARVAARHASCVGYESPCFQNLQVQKFFGGAKLGKALQGARAPIVFH